MTSRYKVIVSGLVAAIIYFIIFFFLPVKDRTLINLLGVVGFLLSILGIVISYLQILSVKEIAELTQERVKETEEKLKETQDRIKENFINNNKLLMVSDLSRKAAMVNEIQGFLIDEKIEMCILRMKDLKATLIILKNQPKYTKFTQRAEFAPAFDNFNINLDNIQKHHFHKTKIDLYKINKDMEVLSTMFLSVEHTIKKTQ